MAVRELELEDLSQAASPSRDWFADVMHRLIGPFRRGEIPAPQPSTGFYTDTTVCIGCKACEVACKQWNQLPADGFRFSGNSYDNTEELSAESWRHVKFVEQFPGDDQLQPASLNMLLDTSPAGRWLMMSDVCKHCETAPCQQACPTGAILYNEFANVYIQPDICNGCSYCIAACPFGVITRSKVDGHAHKCTLCYDRQKDGLVPACAKRAPRSRSSSGRSKNCASGPGDGWSSSTRTASPVRTFTATAKPRPILR